VLEKEWTMSLAGLEVLEETDSLAALDAPLDEDEMEDGDERTRRLLRAVETYKAACAAVGTEPTQEEAWLVFLSALGRAPGDK
jgi:hypothetical protein